MKKRNSSMTGPLTSSLIALPLAVGLSVAVPVSVSAQIGLDPVVQIPVQLTEARQINPTTVELKYADGSTMTLDFYGSNIFRLFQDNHGGILRNPKATPEAQILTGNARRAMGGIEVKTSDRYFEISTPKVLVTIDRQKVLMTVKNLETGKVVVEWTDPLKFDKESTTISLRASKDEYFYGGGVQNGRFSHKGKAIAIENTNNWVDGGVASPTPFYWSTGGYGLMWHTFRPGRYDFGATEDGKVLLSHKENYLDVFFMINDGAVPLLNDFYQLTGHPVLLPKFGFYMGHLNAYNRDYWKETENGFMLYEDGKRYNESQKPVEGGLRESLNGEDPAAYQFSARAAIDRYQSQDMPLGWFLPNDGYACGYGQGNSLDENIQNLKEFGDYAHSKGVEIGLWTQSDLHPKEGVEPLLQRDIVKEVRDASVRVLKTDVAWVGAGYSFGLNGVTDVGQIMPYYGSNARPFIVSVCGWAGTQRYAGIWTGDQSGGDWEYIRYHIPTFIGSGLSGQPNITNDLDGIFGGKNVPVNIRDYQWKTFTPMLLNMDGWGANPKYPQALGEPAASINRWYLKMKTELMPYAYSVAREAVDGKPIVRAMFLDYPNAYTLGHKTQYQYMFGPSLLVAPIYKETRMDKDGNDIRNGIYLPEGTWVDYFSGDIYQGGVILNNFDCPIWKIPVFVKADAILPMTLPHNNPSAWRTDYRAYEIYALQGTTFTEYDDDGRTQDYLSGNATSTAVTTRVDGNKLSIHVDQMSGEYTGVEFNKLTDFRINVSAAPKKVEAKVGGKKVKLAPVQSEADFLNGENVYYYNASPELNRYATPGSEFAKVSVKKNPQLWVRLAKCDVVKNAVEVTVKGFQFSTTDPLRKSQGTLAAPQVVFSEAAVGPYNLAPSWQKVEGADFYEVEFDGMCYSGIRDLTLDFEGLEAETAYTFRVRAVNAQGASAWAEAKAKTLSNPLEFAIQGIKASVTCEDQPGQTIDHLFDFDMKAGWHTKWGKGEAVPFDMLIDLRSVNQLDRLDYYHREDGGNGTILHGTVSYSTDRQTWSTPVPFSWERLGAMSTFAFAGHPSARYIKISISEAVGNFGSGHEMYIFKVADTESILQGDINRDKRIDEGDFTSYMNYTGLRRGDGDFDYVSIGDVNGNGLIDAYDASLVSTALDGGARPSSEVVAGSLVLTPSAKTYRAGDEVRITVSGRDLRAVNALSFALPYDTQEFEYVGIETVGTKKMTNLTRDRQHTDGTRALYPTFVNRGQADLLDQDGPELFIIKFKAKRAGRFHLTARDGLLIDRGLGVVKF